MDSEIKIYKVRDFIRKTEAGEIDFDRSVKIIRELAVAASFHSGCNILIDMRDTTVTDETSIGSLLLLAVEMASYESLFQGKIANVVPGDEKRLSIARQFKASLDLQGFRYEIFTSFEEAINWLSDITDLGARQDSSRTDQSK